jgi:hypothetical protein
VLVLRSRPAGYRQPRLIELGEALALRDQAALGELLRARYGVYNRQAAELATMTGIRTGAEVRQVAVPDSARLIGRLEADSLLVAEALRLGARAMASALQTDPIDLSWQPAVYRAARVPTRRTALVRPHPLRVGVPSPRESGQAADPEGAKTGRPIAAFLGADGRR